MKNQYGNKKYIHLAAGTVLMLILGLIYAWSIFRVPFSQMFPGWSTSQLSLTFTISMICFCLGGLLSGKLLARLSARFMIIIAAVFLFCGFFLVSKINAGNPSGSLAQLYIFYGVLCGTGVGIGYNTIIATITKWFPEAIGFASGVLLMGFGLGGLILGSLIQSIISTNGLLTTFTYLAVITSVVLVIGSFFVKAPPVKTGSDNEQSDGYTTGQMLSSPQFWLFFVWTMMIAAAGLLVINSAATIAIAFGAPAILGLIVSVANGAGRILVGTMADKIGRKKTILIDTFTMLLAGAVLIVGAVVNNPPLIFVGLVCVGVAYGGAPPLSSTVVKHLFGAKHFAVNLSIANFMVIPAAILGPLLSSYLQDISSGEYTLTFVMIVVLAGISLILNWVLSRKSESL